MSSSADSIAALSMEPVIPVVEVFLAEGTGGSFVWRNLGDDVDGGVRVSWGIQGGAPKDRVASPGSLAFSLDNSDLANFGQGRGTYTPGHANVRPGFAVSAAVRFSIIHPRDGTRRVLWYGVIDSVSIGVGIKGQKVAVRCVDWMDEAGRARLSGLAVQTNVQSDALFATLVAAVPTAPPQGTRIGSGSDIYPYALDNARDESGKVLGELQKLAVSEFGSVFVEAGVAVFEGRRLRGGAGSVRLSLDEDNALAITAGAHARDDILNRVQVSVHPRRVDLAATTVLFTLGTAQRIERKTALTINCPYRDPAQLAQRVGGKDMVVPVATTDYLFNAAADGTGTDLTSQLSVSYVVGAGGNSATVLVVNNGPFDGHLTFLRLRGRGIYDFEPVVCEQGDPASRAGYGENVYGFDMPYQASPANGIDTAQYILNLNKDPRSRISGVSFLANWDSKLLDALFNMRISDRVALTFPELGLAAAEFFVNGIALECSAAGLCKVILTLTPCGTAQFWLLGVDGRTELDETTVLGFGLFVPGWILGTSALGEDTFLG